MPGESGEVEKTIGNWNELEESDLEQGDCEPMIGGLTYKLKPDVAKRKYEVFKTEQKVWFEKSGLPDFAKKTERPSMVNGFEIQVNKVVDFFKGRDAGYNGQKFYAEVQNLENLKRRIIEEMKTTEGGKPGGGKPEEMSQAEREARIAWLKRRYERELSPTATPNPFLEIGPSGHMSARQRAKIDKRIAIRFAVEREIKLLEKSDEELKEQKIAGEVKKAKAEIQQLERRIEDMSKVGVSAKTGKIKPKYKREIEESKKRIRELNDKIALLERGETPSQASDEVAVPSPIREAKNNYYFKRTDNKKLEKMGVPARRDGNILKVEKDVWDEFTAKDAKSAERGTGLTAETTEGAKGVEVVPEQPGKNKGLKEKMVLRYFMWVD